MVAVPEWLVRLQASLSPYAIPFAFRRKSGTRSALSVAIAFSETQYLLTAAHVVNAVTEEVKGAEAECLIGPLEVTLSRRIVNRHERHDMATVRLEKQEVAALEATGYRVCRPTEWPSPEVEIGDALIVIGAPRGLREDRSGSEVQLGLASVAGLTTIVRSHELVCQLDARLLRQYQIDIQADIGALGRLSGSSGGPVFQILEQRGVVVHHLCGIVREEVAFGEDRLVYVSRLGSLSRAGSLKD